MRISTIAIAFLLALLSGTAPTLAATPAQPSLHVTLSADSKNPQHPTMGDWMTFTSQITNTGTTPIHGDVAWISLVQVDRGKEQPVDLEDWSAHKADVVATLAPGESRETIWPMRLIQAGNYRVVVSAASGTAKSLVASPMLAFTVAEKPVVQSARILPVAIGVPILLLLAFLLRFRTFAKANSKDWL